MGDLLQSDIIAKAQALGIQARAIVEGLRVGEHKSPYRGFSVEFVQHREYVPGDDLRHIDWKSYGRNERYTIKQYEQETNFIAHLVVDASKSMLYGEGESNKLHVAKILSACLGYLIIHQRDMVSLNVFDSGWAQRLPASGQVGHVHTMLTTLESVVPQDKNRIGPLLHDLAQQARRRGIVFLLSDCFDEVDQLMEGLQHLRFQGHEVILFHILHPDEVDFPFGGMVKFDGMEDKLHLLTRPQLIRPAYLRAMEKYIGEMRKGCERNRVDYIQVNTGKPLAPMLAQYLARRLKF